MAIYGYVRVSSIEQARSGISLEDQQQQIRAYADANRLGDVAQIFVDAGVSGGVALDKREQGKRLLDHLAEGDIVIITKLDRAFRKASDCLNNVEKFKKKKISLHIIQLNGDVIGNGISALFLTIMAAVAEFERDIISERQKDVKRHLKKQGRYLGGKKKSGYDIVTVKNEEGKEVRIAKENENEQKAISFIRNNMGAMSLASMSDQIDTKYGLKWNVMRISRIRRDILDYQSKDIAARWRGEKSVDWNERKAKHRSPDFAKRRKIRLQTRKKIDKSYAMN
jgi:DNA invertase Pin-like site-specific DNA recombinase